MPGDRRTRCTPPWTATATYAWASFIAEVAVEAGAPAGQGVELAVRLGNAAAPGELLVSSTAAGLLASAEVALRLSAGTPLRRAR